MNKARPVGSNPIGRQLATFLLRWVVSSFAMWISIRLFAKTSSPLADTLWTYVLAGLIFSLPFIILTLGLFVLIVNAAMVAITIWLLPDISMDFGGAVLSAITISIINYLANFLVPTSYTGGKSTPSYRSSLALFDFFLLSVSTDTVRRKKVRK